MMDFFFRLSMAPGVIIHELSHALFCIFGGIKIHKIKLYSFNPKSKIAGFVTHDEPESFFQNFLISFGPFFINSLTTLILFSLIKSPWLVWQNTLYLWLGLTIGLQAIPSTGDAQSLLQSANRKVFKNPFIVLAYPFVFLIFLLNWLKRIHFDLLYVLTLFWLGNIFLKNGL
ncbi:MAG TPA: metalloprotease family protein [Candidatus Magasanikbacteria bacterium]|nr:metalloprotease family protein [Candidatus Magasanikbacteria bacterium]